MWTPLKSGYRGTDQWKDIPSYRDTWTPLKSGYRGTDQRKDIPSYSDAWTPLKTNRKTQTIREKTGFRRRTFQFKRCLAFNEHNYFGCNQFSIKNRWRILSVSVATSYTRQHWSRTLGMGIDGSLIAFWLKFPLFEKSRDRPTD